MGNNPYHSIRETFDKVKPLIEHIVFIWKKRLSNELLGGNEDYRVRRRENLGRLFAETMGVQHRRKINNN